MNTIIACIAAISFLFILDFGLIIFNKNVRDNTNFLFIGISPILTILVVWVMFSFYDFTAALDTEYLGGYAIEASYYEDWDEEVSCRHEISCNHTKYCTDSNNKTYSCGTQHSNDGYEHSYDVDYHPPYWKIIDNNKQEFSIDSAKFKTLSNSWKNRKFIELNRNYHSKDGNKYSTFYNDDTLSLEPTTIVGTYKNKIPVSNSIFRLSSVTTQEVQENGLYKYPEVFDYYQEAVLSPAHLDLRNQDYWLRYLNAKLGRSKQVRVFLLVYLNKAEDVSYLQERYWEGGNKNELNICVGINNNLEVLWCRVFSYTNRSDLITDIKYEMLGKGNKELDLVEFSKWLYPEVEQKWVRKEFTEINKDLVVLYPFWYGFLSIILSVIAGLSLAFADYIRYYLCR